MKNISCFIVCSLLIFSLYAQYSYPAGKTVDSSDSYWGTTVKDPYRWLENINGKTKHHAQKKFSTIYRIIAGWQHFAAGARQR